MIDLTGIDSSPSSSGDTTSTNTNTTNANHRQQEIHHVYLVFHQQEPYYGSIFSGDRYCKSPENLNKKCLGVYRTAEAANEAALEYWEYDLGLELPDNDECMDGLVNLFWDELLNGADTFTLSKRVFVERRKLK